MNCPSEREKALAAALNAMLTQFGMDEDEWSKPTFDQARAALGWVDADTGEQRVTPRPPAHKRPPPAA